MPGEPPLDGFPSGAAAVGSDASTGGTHPEQDAHRLWAWTLMLVLVGGLVWFGGLLVLSLPGVRPGWRAGWDVVWGLAGMSFLGAVVLPIPGTTTALLVVLRDRPLLGALGVFGAAAGGTIGAALLLGLGDVGRRVLRRRATHRPWSRTVLHWSERLVSRWTYFGVGLLLMPPFLPRMAVLYPAVALRLRAIPFLLAVFVGTLVRNGLYFTGIRLFWP